MPRSAALVLLAPLILAAACAARPPAPSAGMPSRQAPATMSAARAALAAGHLVEALELFERLATEARRAEDRAEAMERAAFLRVNDQAELRDLERARHWIALRRTQGGRADRLLEMNALEAVILELEKASRNLAAKVSAPAAEAPGLAAPQRGEGADVRALKASNASLQAEVARLRAELRQKEEALRKIAASLAGGEREPR